MEGTCPFCAKLARLDSESSDEVVWSFPHSVAFLGPWQFYEGYCVLVSRAHATELSQLSDDNRRAFLDEMCLMALAIEKAFTPLKLNYELLGNQVPHLHWHLFPRSKADPDHLKPVWLNLNAAERDPALLKKMQGSDQRDAIAANLRHHLETLSAPRA